MKNFFQKCSLVITVNGTAGLEAAFYRKPSIVFTDLGYTILPSVHKLKSIEDLPSAIHLSLKKKIEANDVDSYISLIEKNSINFDLINFFSDYQNHFYFGGNLLDVNISLEKMQEFLDLQKTTFTLLSQEYLKKIQELKNN